MLRRIPAWAPDTAIAVSLAIIGILALQVADVPDGGSDTDPGAYFLILLITLPLAARQRWTISVFVTVLAGGFLYAARGYAQTNVDFFGLVLAFYSVSTYEQRRISIPASVAGAVVIILGIQLSPTAGQSGASFLTVMVVVAGAWLLGDAMRRNRLAQEQLARQAEDLRRARLDLDDKAAAEERLRIARELHDTLAHHLSAVIVQAAVASENLRSHPSVTADALANIGATGRAALDDTRQILGILRRAPDPLASAPRLSDLSDLYEQARLRGITVAESVHGTQTTVPDTVQLAAYRVIQEALTNVGKHSTGARAHVLLDYQPQTLRVEVRNERAANGVASTYYPTARLGLAGMQERVRAAGGTLDASPSSDGGFLVIATLPLAGAT